MTAVEFRTLGFSARYRCWARDHVPPGEPLFRFPDGASVAAARSDRFVVSFAPETGPSWTGSFLREFEGCADLLIACPDPMKACVVAGGLATVVDVAHPDLAEALGVVPVTDALGCAPAGVLVLASFNALSAFDSSMKMIWTAELESDGIEFGDIDGGDVSIRAYMPGVGDWVSRTISLADGAASKPEGSGG